MRTKNNLSRTLRGRVAMTVIVTALTIFASTTKAWAALTVTASPEEGGTFRVNGSKLYVTPAPRYYLASVTREGTMEPLIAIAPADGEPYYLVSATDYITITFRACTNNVRVKFNMNGHGGEYFTQNGTIDYTIDKPTDPTEEGLVFGGWYMDADGTIPYDFNSVLKDTLFYSIPHQYYTMNLYAKWLVYVISGNCGKVDSNAGLDGSEVTWSGYKNVHSDVFDEIIISGNGEIMQDAFINNQNIKSVVINDGVTSIGQAAFLGCEGLTSVTIPNSVTSIGQGAFQGCSGLTSVTIPNSVTSIGESAFRDCSGLTSVTIGNSVTSIGQGAFFYCTGLTSVTIPASVTSIGGYAFNYCWGMRSLSIPASVTSIGQEAFYNCSALTSVTIPASVTSIGQDAFFDCFSLASVTIYAPSLQNYGKDAFYGNAGGRKIYVFENSVDTYKARWADYAGNIQAIPASNLAVTTPVNENPQNTGEFWSTYYHPAANVKINTDGVEIYKATLNEQKTSVTLTKVDGNVIKAGQAVMLKATGSGALSMELTPEVPTGNYSGNDLKGGNTVQAGYDAYTLAAENNTIGFYKFNGTLNASKAHLEIPQGSTSGVREFIGFDAGDATGISDATRLKEEIIKNKEVKSEWYTLDGRRLSGKPTAKGIYIVKGRKVIR